MTPNTTLGDCLIHEQRLITRSQYQRWREIVNEEDPVPSTSTESAENIVDEKPTHGLIVTEQMDVSIPVVPVENRERYATGDAILKVNQQFLPTDMDVSFSETQQDQTKRLGEIQQNEIDGNHAVAQDTSFEAESNIDTTSIENPPQENLEESTTTIIHPEDYNFNNSGASRNDVEDPGTLNSFQNKSDKSTNLIRTAPFRANVRLVRKRRKTILEKYGFRCSLM